MAQKKTAPAKSTQKKDSVKKNHVVWIDPVNPKHVRGFMSEESKESFEKWWSDEHNRQDKSTEVIIDLIVNPHESTTEAKQESYRQELKVLYAKKLERVKDPAKIRTFESVLSGWDKFTRPLDIVIAMNELTLYLKENPHTTPGKTEKPQDTRPLHEKIHWQKDKTLLKKHLEGLKAASYITYKNIDDVISGTETPRTVKHHNTGTPKGSEDRNILYIFATWWKLGLVDQSFYPTEKYMSTPEGKKTNTAKLNRIQYQEFIVNSFAHENGEPFKNLSTAAKGEVKKGFSRESNDLKFFTLSGFLGFPNRQKVI